MGVRRRDFLLSATLAAAAVSVTAAFGQAVTAAQSGGGAQSAASIPAFGRRCASLCERPSRAMSTRL